MLKEAKQNKTEKKIIVFSKEATGSLRESGMSIWSREVKELINAIQIRVDSNVL
jgi:hypothetical protein